MAIRGKSASHIRSRLRSFFVATGHNRAAWYLLLANGKSIPLRKLRTLRGWSTIWKGLDRGRPVLLRAGIGNAEIRIKNNARIGYVDPEHGNRITAKIALGSAGRKESLAREIKARRLLQRTSPDLPIPRIVDYDRQNLRWLVEEHIDAEKRADAMNGINMFLRDIAEKLYKPSRRSQPATVWLARRSASLPELRGILQEAGALSEDDAVACAGSWPVAFLHGDLSAGNMIFGKGGNVHLVDWERFGPGPVAWDLRKLIPLAPALSEQLLQKLSGPEDMPPAQQIRLALAAELLRRRRTRQEITRYLMSDLGKSAGDAETFVAAREQQLLNVLASHFAESPARK